MNAGVKLWARCELRNRWGTLALLALLIAIGGGASVAAAAGARRTETAFDRMMTATHQPNLSVNGAGDDGFQDLDPRLLDQVMNIPGVTGATQFAFVAVAPEGFVNFFALALIDRRGETIQALLLDGAPIEDIDTLAAEDVLLNDAMYHQLGQEVGDTVVLRSLTAEQFDASLRGETSSVPGGPVVSARIAGVSRGPEDVSDAPDPFLLLPPAYYEKYHELIGGCRCTVMLNVDPASIDQVTAALEKIYPGAAIEQPEDLAGRIADTVSLQKRAWWLIAGTAVLAAVIALYQASARAGRMLRAGDDARRALGMTRRERRLGLFLVIAPAALVGSLASIGVAYGLSPVAPVGLTRLAEPSPGLRWEPAVVVPGVLVVLVASLTIAAIATLLDRHHGERRHRSAQVVGPQLALGNRLAFGPGRGAIIGVLLSTAGLVGALTLEHSVDHVLATPALYGADFDASNFLDGADDKRATGEQLSLDRDVEAVGLVWAYLGSTLHVVGPTAEADVDANAYESLKGILTVKQTEGREPVRDDEVAVGRDLLDQLGATIGGKITAQGINGPVELTIVGDDSDPGVDVAGHGFAMTVEGLSALGDASVQGTVIRFAPGVDHDELVSRYADMGFSPVMPPSEVGHIGQLGGLPTRVAQLLLLLGVAALLNSVVLTIKSGRREVALHRVLGFTSAQVVRVHLWQSVVTGLSGVVIGGGLGFIVGRAINRQLVDNVGAIAETIVPGQVWTVAIVTIAACLGTGVLISTVALRRRPGLELRTE
jgi:hypothetical protein